MIGRLDERELARRARERALADQPRRSLMQQLDEAREDAEIREALRREGLG